MLRLLFKLFKLQEATDDVEARKCMLRDKVSSVRAHTVASGKVSGSVLTTEDVLQGLPFWYAVSSNISFCKFPSANPIVSSKPSIPIKRHTMHN